MNLVQDQLFTKYSMKIKRTNTPCLPVQVKIADQSESPIALTIMVWRTFRLKNQQC